VRDRWRNQVGSGIRASHCRVRALLLGVRAVIGLAFMMTTVAVVPSGPIAIGRKSRRGPAPCRTGALAGSAEGGRGWRCFKATAGRGQGPRQQAGSGDAASSPGAGGAAYPGVLGAGRGALLKDYTNQDISQEYDL
jgi:hypothetical protein